MTVHEAHVQSRTGLGTILTVVGIPVSVAMDVGAVTAGVLTIANSRIEKCLRTKLKKHERMRTLAETKLSAISDCISKALKMMQSRKKSTH